MKKMRQESLADKMYRLRRVLCLAGVPVALILFVIVLMPRAATENHGTEDDSMTIKDGSLKSIIRKQFAVVFDAGSSGSRVHVFCFDQNLDLLPIGDDLELFVQKKPGLSAYANNPEEAATSLKFLLEKAEAVVPTALRKYTPVRIGATAGLRQLPGDASEKILQAVKEFMSRTSSLKFLPEWVTVLDGAQEGSFQWITLNYLLRKLDGNYTNTVGIVDLGGGSVQMAYAVPDNVAKNAPKPPEGAESYVKELVLLRKKYHLYVHSYLRYGLLAARAEILKLTENGDSACILTGYHGIYKYGSSEYKASSPPSGSDFDRCKQLAHNALNVNAACSHMTCTFGGVWNGGGGDGQKQLFVASFFYDRAAEAGFIDSSSPVAVVRPNSFRQAAEKACQSSLENAGKLYPDVDPDHLPYICMDLSYQYILLVDGFGIDSNQEITLVKKVKYENSYVEAAWPLGSAIELVSLSE